MSTVYSTSKEVKVVTEGGIPVQQVDTEGNGILDPTYSNSTPVAVREVDDAYTGTFIKVRLTTRGMAVIKVDESGVPVATPLGGTEEPAPEAPAQGDGTFVLATGSWNDPGSFLDAELWKDAA